MQLDRIGCRKNDCDAAPSEASEDGNDMGVEEEAFAAERLIEQDRARRPDQGLGEPEPLHQAGGKCADASCGVDVETDLSQRGFYLGSAVRSREIMKCRVVLEGFANGEKRIVASALGDVGQAGRNVMSRDLFAEPIDRALVGLEEAGETEKECRFSRAWPADESYDFATSHVEADIAERGDRYGARSRAGLVRLVETPDRQCDRHWRDPPAIMWAHDCIGLQTQTNR